MASHRSPPPGYQRHQPENTALYAIVEQRLPKLCAGLAQQDASLPAFVTREFHDYLRCGLLEYGFIRVKCNGCRHEQLVAFSCKRRGFCPSCGARRMIETSAHLVDHVIPPVAVRQWVLSFPWPLRMLFASRPQALSSCLAVITRAIQTSLAQRAGLKATDGARTGIVTLIQRFGSALNLNVHLHMLVLDGVYTWEHGRPRFHRVGAPNRKCLERLLDRLIRRLLRRLTRDGWLVFDPEQPWLDLEPADTLDSLAAASIRYRIASGPETGRRTLTLKNPRLARSDTVPKALTTDQNGFSLKAAVACQPHERGRLERLCRYITRPAICLDRLSTNSAGQVVYRLKHPFRDGTTHVVFSPEDFIARLAALVPRPGFNLTRYHGVFAPNSAFRRAVVPGAGKRRRRKGKTPSCRDDGPKPPKSDPVDDSDPPIAPLTWAQRLKRVFEFDITLCPYCGGRLRVIADVTDPAVIRKILDHVHQRAPPIWRSTSEPYTISSARG
jgi:hypothetical protein